MDTPPDSQRKAWARLSTLTSFVSRICFFKARCSDSDSVNGFIVIPPSFDFTRVRLGGVKKILSTYLASARLPASSPLGGLPRDAADNRRGYSWPGVADPGRPSCKTSTHLSKAGKYHQL